ncbi:MAG: cadherin domain-containing protein [Sulfurimonas sp.]|nr:cadherin domain-containing protein [Sulfurimonas sp.]
MILITKKQNRGRGNSKSYLKLTLLFLFTILFFTGCSDRDNNDKSTEPAVTTHTGYLVDNLVGGVSYSTDSFSGLTDSNGTFSYTSDDTNIIFYIGDLQISDFNLSNMNSDGFVLPSDMVGVDRNNTRNTTGIRILQVLQSLDDDGNPDNGIIITQEIRDALTTAVDLFDPNVPLVDIQTILASLGKTLVSEEEVVEHYEKILRDNFGINVDTISPLFTSSASVSVDENQTSALTLIATDSSTITYSISTADSDSFDINSSSGVVSFKVLPDYETKTSYTFIATATDEAGNKATQSIAIAILDVNEYIGYAPVITSSASVSVNENQTSALSITATDANGETITYSISGGDWASFNIDASTGVVTFKVAPDYETKTSYTFIATATDEAGNKATQSIAITILDVNEYIGYAPVITSSASVSVTENQTSALSITATDANGETITYSISTADSDSFDINSLTGVVSFKVAPDYETKTSYTFIATATDTTTRSDTQSVTININNIVEVLALAAFIGSVDENATIGTEVGNITITDAGDTAITSFTLSDTTNFEVNASGYIKTKTLLDYETTTSYALTAYATNGAGNSASVNITININDIGEFYIKSAVYDNNATVTPTDDKLYIYFDQAINPTSIAADMSTNYTLEGIGAIGTASISAYDNARFHQHIITLNNDGSASTALVAKDTNISIATDVLQDTSGNYTIYDANKSTVEKFRVVLKTGQTTSYPNANASDRDDGYYQSGKTRSYTDNGDTVTDNATGLIWQQEDDNTLRNWTDAGTYCGAITLDANSDFRLPTRSELASLSDYGTNNPAIDPIFQNTISDFYWSSTTHVANISYAWGVYFYDGYQYSDTKTNDFYVRCVRAGQ